MFCCINDIAHRYTILNVVGSPPQNVAVGRVNKEGFVPVAGMAKVVWPGGTTRTPQDTQRSDPAALSIGWVTETAWGTPALQQESRMYAQQAIDEINDDFFILPNTHLTLEGDFSVNGNNQTAEAFNAIDARATAAGRPLAAVLAVSSSHMKTIYALQANVTVTQPSTGVPIIGYYTGAGTLSDSTKFPNFVRLYPPVSETQHIYKKAALQWGWTRIGLIGDPNDAFSTGFFDLMNGTDPSNPSNLQPPLNTEGGPYDAMRLDIAYAALIDLAKDTDATKDALVTAIKAKDVKVIMLFGQSAFVEGIVLYGVDRGIFGDGYQVMVSSGSVVPSKMNPRCLETMDGAVQVQAFGIAPQYPGLQRASKFWSRHSPTLAPAGADTTTPFQVDGRKPRFQDASLYDSIMFAAVGIDACLKDGCRPVGHGYEEVMPYLRKTSIDGVAGRQSIKAGSNDPQVREPTLFVLCAGL